ncbi:MAG TPA: hypothetical protein VHO25_00135 [Polyangiaceae bacterium]|nr:hypothetical protein [Polyangiaceae bacterium]
MTTDDATRSAHRQSATVGGHAALATAAGIVLSGPLALLLVNATHPQPPWENAATFAEHYHPIQVVPYLGGILLVTALVMLLATIHVLALDQHKLRTTAALVFTAAFATLIFFNYVVQTTFLPELARTYQDHYAGTLSALSMSNPKSLAWGIEMWGWGLFGLATWLVAPVFQGNRTARLTAQLFVANGIVSIVGTLWTVLQPGWCMTPIGLMAFASWNLLLLVMVFQAWRAFRSTACQLMAGIRPDSRSIP